MEASSINVLTNMTNVPNSVVCAVCPIISENDQMISVIPPLRPYKPGCLSLQFSEFPHCFCVFVCVIKTQSVD